MIDSYERLEKTLGLQYLHDRMCDLKIRIAELNYALGLPAALGEIEADPALLGILPQVVGWRQAIERINTLTRQAAAGWVNDLIKRGTLTISAIGVEIAKRP